MKNLKNLLLASLCVNIIVVSAFAWKFYNNWFENGVLKSPFRESIFNASPIEHGKIHFVGDSHVEAFELNELLHNANLRNRGVWGDMSSNVLKRIGSVLASRPKKLFLIIGVNDICSGQSVDASLSNMDKIIKQCQNSVPVMQIYLTSVLPTNQPILHSKENTVEKIKVLNEGYKALAAKYHTYYIDLFPHFLQAGGLKPAYSIDGLHLNGEGYVELARLLKPYVGD